MQSRGKDLEFRNSKIDIPKENTISNDSFSIRVVGCHYKFESENEIMRKGKI